MIDIKYRNHPTTIIKNILISAVVMFFMSILHSTSLASLMIFIVGMVLFSSIIVLFWARTTITFSSNEAVVESNVIYKKKRTIPYNKIASVNVVRDIFNIIFGTTTLSININSSSGAAAPMAKFVFSIDIAEKIRDELTSNVFNEPVDDLTNYRSAINLSMKDSILHGFIGVSTYQMAYALVLLIYSILSLTFLEGRGILVAVFMLIFGEAIPVLFIILKYGNFKVYRINDQIHLQHGMIQNYVSKFDINRINAIRIKRTFFARILGKSSLEAEVIGINAVNDDKTPTLCILADDDKIVELMRQLVPEFIHEPEMIKQPKRARIPLLIKSTAASIMIMGMLAYPSHWLYIHGDTAFNDLSSFEALVLKHVLIVAMAIIVPMIFYGAHISMKVREFGLGENMFNMVNGLLDRQIMIIQYDRVQITKVSAGRIALRLGLAKCTISLMSSVGYKNIRSGYFDRDELYKIGDTMLKRLKDGTYRYNKNSI